MVKSSLLAFTAVALSATCGTASAETLSDAIALAYRSNPALLAARADQRALDEQYIQARDALGPTAGISEQHSREDAQERRPATGERKAGSYERQRSLRSSTGRRYPMRSTWRSASIALVLAGLGVAGCGAARTPAVAPSSRLVPVPGSKAGKIVLSAVGARRIGIQTDHAGASGGSITVASPTFRGTVRPVRASRSKIHSVFARMLARI